MEKQFETRVHAYMAIGLSKEDAEFVSMVQNTYTVTLTALEEHDSPKDHFSYPQDVKWAQKQLREGNEWGWCCAKVTVSEQFPADRSESSYLGACSYKGKTDFMRGGYFVDMVRECYEALKAKETATA